MIQKRIPSLRSSGRSASLSRRTGNGYTTIRSAILVLRSLALVGGKYLLGICWIFLMKLVFVLQPLPWKASQ
jgi:hypothetical protein